MSHPMEAHEVMPDLSPIPGLRKLGRNLQKSALGLVALLITFFAVYVAWTTMWGNRWYRKGPAAGDAGTSERAA